MFINSQNANYLTEITNKAYQSSLHTCTSIIDRLKNETINGESNWNNIYNSLTAWNDSSFTSDSAIYWSEAGYSTGSLSKYYNNTWNRVYSLKNAEIIGLTNMFLQIDQGQIGDCYFLSALSAIAEFPSRLQNIILTEDISTSGIFAAQVFIRGVRKIIMIDDYLPFQNQNQSQLIFNNQGLDGSLWGCLMEKLWAKVNGNYEYIQGGVPLESYNFLLGAPSNSFSMSDGVVGFNLSDNSTWKTAASNAWSIISDADFFNYPMSCNVGTVGSFSLPTNHAYSLIGAYTIMDGNKVTNRLYKIRNPWGTDNFSGNWNDYDYQRWTISNQVQVQFQNDTNDGVFYIEDIDFVQAFSSFTISYYDESYTYNTLEILNDKLETRYFAFNLTQVESLYVSTYFYTNKMYPPGCRNGSSKGVISLFTYNGAQVQANYNVFDTIASNYFYFPQLAAGSYVIKTQMSKWDTGATNDFTLQVYTPLNVSLAQMNTTMINAYQQRILQQNLLLGFAYVPSQKTVAYKYMTVNYGSLSGTYYVEVVQNLLYSLCSSLIITTTFNQVDDSQTYIATNTVPCVKVSANTYNCTCDLSIGKNNICQYDYYYLGKSFSFAYTKVKC